MGITAAALLAHQTLVNARPRGTAAYVAANLGATGVLLAAAVRWGVRPAELGLAWPPRPAGVRRGVTATVVAAAVVGAGLGHPLGRRLLRDERTAGMGGRAAATQALVRIPLGTVVLEEVAFRGLLPALARQAGAGAVAAERWSAALFGLWHVPPTVVALRLNQVTGRRATAVLAGAVVVTGGAGLIGARLAGDSGVVAPALAHWGVNAVALLAGVRAHRAG